MIVRLVLICLLLIFFVNRYKTIPRLFVFAVLLCLYSFSFILSPIWNSPQQFELKLLFLILLFIFIPLLSFHASFDLELVYKLKDIKALILLSLLLYLVNYIPLYADIPYRGDEDYHISFILDMKLRFDYLFHSIEAYFVANWQIGVIVVMMLAGAIIFNLKLKKAYPTILLIYLGLALFSFGAIYVISDGFVNNFATHFTLQSLRYPNLQKWLSFFLIYPSFYKDIALYRIIPLVSTILLSWFLYIKFREKNVTVVLAVALAFVLVTIPLVYFYTTLLYLEMPVVLLMTVTLFDLPFLITSGWDKLPTRLSWYFLILLSFLKETTLLFLLLIVTFRIIYHLRGGFTKKLLLKSILQEMKIGILILSPVLIYLYLRIFFSDYKAHSIELNRILYYFYYPVLLKSLFDQLGFFFILSLSGFVLLIIRRNRLLLTALVVLAVSQILFILTDSVGYISYVGYSRWNLFLLPMFYFTTYYYLISQNKKMQIISVVLLLLSNIFLLPIHPDGTRLPNWGAPLVDTAEYTYPYEKAIQYLNNRGDTQNLLITGHYYHYDGVRFYFNKYQFWPITSEHFFALQRFDKETEQRMLNDLFNGVILADKILYQSVNNIDLDEKKVYGGSYKIVKKIKNSEHSLYIFSKLL